MRKWALFAAACAAILTGCDSASGGGGGAVIPPPGDGLSRVNTALLDKPGRFEITYNTGQGRAEGSITAVIRRLTFVDDLFPAGDSRNNVDTLLNPERNLGLDQYTSQSIAVNVPINNIGFSGPVNGRLFQTFNLEIDRLLIENANGGFTTLEGSNNQPILDEDFPANILALGGRSTAVELFLDDAMITVQDLGNGPELVFDRDLFEAINLVDDGNGNFKLMGFLNDYIVFDITNVANKPTMSTSVPATLVWFSGDGIALSGDAPQMGGGPEAMEVLTPIATPIEGLFMAPVNLPGGTGPGTFTLRQIDPRDLNNIARITALQGTWKPYFDADPSKSPFLDLGSFEVFTFPQTLNQEKHEMIMIARNGLGQITNMYFGEVNFNSNTFSVWPIDQVDDGDANNEVSGTVSNLKDRDGGAPATHKHVRSGSFTITAGGVPGGFSASGRFIVYRL